MQEQADKHNKILKYFKSSKSESDDNKDFELTCLRSEEVSVLLVDETWNIINQDNLMSSNETELFVPSDSNHSVFENILNYNDIWLWPLNLKHSEIDHIIVTSLNGNEKKV